MNCPQVSEECGVDKLVTVITTDMAVKIGSSTTTLTRAKSGCSWLIKSACNPFTIGYDSTASTMIGTATIPDKYKVQFIELRDASITNNRPNNGFVFTSGQVVSTDAGTVSTPNYVTQYYTSR
jgi:hypothetical protein